MTAAPIRQTWADGSVTAIPNPVPYLLSQLADGRIHVARPNGLGGMYPVTGLGGPPDPCTLDEAVTVAAADARGLAPHARFEARYVPSDHPDNVYVP